MTEEQKGRLLAALENIQDESAFHLETALRALESGVPGELVIRLPRKDKGYVQVGWRGGAAL